MSKGNDGRHEAVRVEIIKLGLNLLWVVAGWQGLNIQAFVRFSSVCS